MSGNGYLTSAELSPASGGTPGPDPGQGQLAHGAAAAWNALAAVCRERHGVQIRSNGSDSLYRPYSRQVYWRNYWCGLGKCGNAAVPGTSNHGWGLAGDVPPFVIALMDAHPEFGFRAVCSDAPWEAWHRKYCGDYDGPNPGGGGTGPTYPTLRKGSHGEAVTRAQRHLRRWNLGLTRPDADGGFGDVTKKAVRDFQIVHGLKPDGVIGESTWAKLRRRDVLLDDERSHVNRIKRKRWGGINPGERAKIAALREWCAKRGRSIAQAAGQTGWDQQHRRERYHDLRKMAGPKW